MFCPYCGHEVPNTMKFCPMCGKQLPAPQAAPVQPAAPAAPADSVPAQPAPVQAAPAANTAPAPKKKKTGIIITAAVLSVVLIGAAVGGYFLLRNRYFDMPSIPGQTQGPAVETPTADRSANSATPPAASASAPAYTEAPPAATAEPTPDPTPIPTDYNSLVDQLAQKRHDLNMDIVSSDVTDYPNVRLYVNLTDPSSGESIILESPTAGILEAITGGQEIERKIRSVERLQNNEGLGMDILVDKSGSMQSDMPQVQSILGDFICSMDFASGDHAEIISFDSYIMYMCNYTNVIDNLLGGIGNMTPYGNTALYDALVTGINNAGGRSGANCVIAFTDGLDNASTHTYQEVVQLALSKNVPLYLIGTGGADFGILNQMALDTGGSCWNIRNISDMDEILRRIYVVQKNMYCIEYESDPDADPYAERTISYVIGDAQAGAVKRGFAFKPIQKRREEHHASRYEIIPADVSWNEANARCVAAGGHMATINSAEEMDLLSEMAEKSGLKYLWIGGYTSQRGSEIYGHWTTGEPFDYTAWTPDEPSWYDKDGTPEFYIMLWRLNDVWCWNDQRDDVAADFDYFKGKMGYIIEYEE